MIDRERLAARLRQADAQASSGRPALAVATLQDVLLDHHIRGLGVASEDGQRTVRADLLVADRLSSLLKRHGAGLYEAYDRQAVELLKQGKDERSPRALEAISASYPVARVLPDALLALGSLQESLDRPADAAKAYKRMASLANVTEVQKARALCGLARCLETQKLWGPARDTYERALARYPDVKLEELGAGATVSSFVSGQLAKDPLAKLAGGTDQARLPMPLSRRWERALASHVLPMTAEGTPPSANSSRVFLAERTTIRPLDPRTGGSAWTFDLKSEPLWIGYLADRALVAFDHSPGRRSAWRKATSPGSSRADSPRARALWTEPVRPQGDAKLPESDPRQARFRRISDRRQPCVLPPRRPRIPFD